MEEKLDEYLKEEGQVDRIQKREFSIESVEKLPHEEQRIGESSLSSLSEGEEEQAEVVFPKLLLISSRIPERERLIASLQEGIKVIEYDWQESSLVELLHRIDQIRDGGSFSSIGFVNHGGAGEFALNAAQEVSLEGVQENGMQNRFWKKLGGFLKEDGRIDLLACSLAASQEGRELLTRLEELSGRNVAASTDLTGSADRGGDWLLESDGINLSTEYFQEGVEQWDHTLSTEYTYTDSGSYGKEHVELRGTTEEGEDGSFLLGKIEGPGWADIDADQKGKLYSFSLNVDYGSPGGRNEGAFSMHLDNAYGTEMLAIHFEDGRVFLEGQEPLGMDPTIEELEDFPQTIEQELFVERSRLGGTLTREQLKSFFTENGIEDEDEQKEYFLKNQDVVEQFRLSNFDTSRLFIKYDAIDGNEGVLSVSILNEGVQAHADMQQLQDPGLVFSSKIVNTFGPNVQFSMRGDGKIGNGVVRKELDIGSWETAQVIPRSSFVSGALPETGPDAVENAAEINREINDHEGNLKVNDSYHVTVDAGYYSGDPKRTEEARDWYRFDAKKGDRILVDIDHGKNSGVSEDLDISIFRLKEDGSGIDFLTRNDDIDHLFGDDGEETDPGTEHHFDPFIIYPFTYEKEHSRDFVYSGVEGARLQEDGTYFMRIAKFDGASDDAGKKLDEDVDYTMHIILEPEDPNDVGGAQRVNDLSLSMVTVETAHLPTFAMGEAAWNLSPEEEKVLSFERFSISDADESEGEENFLGEYSFVVESYDVSRGELRRYDEEGNYIGLYAGESFTRAELDAGRIRFQSRASEFYRTPYPEGNIQEALSFFVREERDKQNAVTALEEAVRAKRGGSESALMKFTISEPPFTLTHPTLENPPFIPIQSHENGSEGMRFWQLPTSGMGALSVNGSFAPSQVTYEVAMTGGGWSLQKLESNAYRAVDSFTQADLDAGLIYLARIPPRTLTEQEGLLGAQDPSSLFDFRLRFPDGKKSFPRTYYAKFRLDNQHAPVITASSLSETSYLGNEYVTTLSPESFSHLTFYDHDEREEQLYGDDQFDGNYEFWFEDLSEIKGGFFQVNEDELKEVGSGPAFTLDQLQAGQVKFVSKVTEEFFSLPAEQSFFTNKLRLRIRDPLDAPNLYSEWREFSLHLRDATHAPGPLSFSRPEAPQIVAEAPEEKTVLTSAHLSASKADTPPSDLIYTAFPSPHWTLFLDGSPLPKFQPPQNLYRFTQEEVDQGRIELSYSGSQEGQRVAFQLTLHDASDPQRTTLPRNFVAEIEQKDLRSNQFIPEVQFGEVRADSVEILSESDFSALPEEWVPLHHGGSISAHLHEEALYVIPESFSLPNQQAIELNRPSLFAMEEQDGFEASFSLDSRQALSTLSFNLGNSQSVQDGKLTEGLSISFEQVGQGGQGNVIFSYNGETKRVYAQLEDFILGESALPVRIQMEQDQLDPHQLMVAIQIADRTLVRERIYGWDPDPSWSYFFQEEVSGSPERAPYVLDDLYLAEYSVYPPIQPFHEGLYRVVEDTQPEERLFQLLLELDRLHNHPEIWHSQEGETVLVETPNEWKNEGENFVPHARYEKKVTFKLDHKESSIRLLHKDAVEFLHASIHTLKEQMVDLQGQILDSDLSSALSEFLSISSFASLQESASLQERAQQLEDWFNSGIDQERERPLALALKELIEPMRKWLLSQNRLHERREVHPLYHYQESQEGKEEGSLVQPFRGMRYRIGDVDEGRPVLEKRDLLKMALDLWDLYHHPMPMENRESVALHTTHFAKEEGDSLSLNSGALNILFSEPLSRQAGQHHRFSGTLTLGRGALIEGEQVTLSLGSSTISSELSLTDGVGLAITPRRDERGIEFLDVALFLEGEEQSPVRSFAYSLPSLKKEGTLATLPLSVQWNALDSSRDELSIFLNGHHLFETVVSSRSEELYYTARATRSGGEHNEGAWEMRDPSLVSYQWNEQALGFPQSQRVDRLLRIREAIEQFAATESAELFSSTLENLFPQTAFLTPFQKINRAEGLFAFADWHRDTDFQEHLGKWIEELISVVEKEGFVDILARTSTQHLAAHEYAFGGVSVLNQTLSNLEHESYLTRRALTTLTGIESFLNQSISQYEGSDNAEPTIPQGTEYDESSGELHQKKYFQEAAYAAIANGQQGISSDYLDILYLRDTLYADLKEIHGEFSELKEKGTGNAEQVEETLNALEPLKRRLDWIFSRNWDTEQENLTSEFSEAGMEKEIPALSEYIEATEQFREWITEGMTPPLQGGAQSRAMSDYSLYHKVLSLFYGSYSESAYNFLEKEDDEQLQSRSGYVLHTGLRKDVSEANTHLSLLNEMMKQRVRRASFTYEEFLRSAITLLRKIRESKKSVMKRAE